MKNVNTESPGIQRPPILPSGPGSSPIAFRRNLDGSKSRYLIPIDDCTVDLIKPQLVEGILDPNTLSVIFGQSNTGKSFLTLDLALHIALGWKWHGRDVEKGSVVYVAAEAPSSIKKRQIAFKRHHQLDSGPTGFYLVEQPVNFFSQGGDTDPFIKEITNLEIKPTLIVIDTLARSFGTGKENATEDMGTYVANLDRIRRETGAHVCVIHHSGKDASKGARGSGSLLAAITTEIEVSDGVATVKKQRDGEVGGKIAFKLHPVEIGFDSKKRAVMSCVVLPDSLDERKIFGKSPKPGTSAANAFELLKAMLAKSDRFAPSDWDLPQQVRVVTVEKFKTLFLESHHAGKSPQARHNAWARAIADLTQWHGVKLRNGELYVFT